MAKCTFCGRHPTLTSWLPALDPYNNGCTCEFCETHEGNLVCDDCTHTICLKQLCNNLATGVVSHESEVPIFFREIGRMLLFFHSVLTGVNFEQPHPADVFSVIGIAIACGNASMMFISAFHGYACHTAYEIHFAQTLADFLNWHTDGRISSKADIIKEVCRLFDIPEDHPYLYTVKKDSTYFFNAREYVAKCYITDGVCERDNICETVHDDGACGVTTCTYCFRHTLPSVDAGLG
jgi:hypothetical protein